MLAPAPAKLQPGGVSWARAGTAINAVNETARHVHRAPTLFTNKVFMCFPFKRTLLPNPSRARWTTPLNRGHIKAKPLIFAASVVSREPIRHGQMGLFQRNRKSRRSALLYSP